jgi:hypothetical protein
MKNTRSFVLKLFITIGIALVLLSPLFAQGSASTNADVTGEFSKAMSDISTIGKAAGGLLGGIVGLLGIGRTAYKLANGDTDVATSLIMAIVGIFLGFVAVMFLT